MAEVGKQFIGINDDTLLNWFSYHPPEQGQPEKYEAIRAAGLQMARVLLANCPVSADLTVAVRKIREAVYSANASIACGGH